MNTESPESHRAGIAHIEGLGVVPMAQWLRDELHEQVHLLAGEAYGYPVQAIVSHHPYLSPEAKKRMASAIDLLVFDWKKTANAWSLPAVQALLSLVGELDVSGAKSKLQSLTESQAFSKMAEALRLAVLGAIATLSSNDDRKFWKQFPAVYPTFAGMAFQVLARIDHEGALELLGRLPQNEQVIGSVARKLPDFISNFALELQAAKLKQISDALASLPPESASPLKLALDEAGFNIPPSTCKSNQAAEFEQKLIIATRRVRSNNYAPLVHAHA